MRGLEKELTGLKVGDQKKIVVKPEDGYQAIPMRSRKSLATVSDGGAKGGDGAGD